MDFPFSLTMTEMTESAGRIIPVSADVVYDLVIAGGGPAAMTAAVYAMRKGMKTALVTPSFGGQLAETAAVENYLGYRFIEGTALSTKFLDQVRQFELAVAEGSPVVSMRAGTPHRFVCANGMILSGLCALIATGKSYRRLGVPGEKEFTGRGVSYCTICDAPLFAGRGVLVAGGGNSAASAALDLAKGSSKVTVVFRRERMTADEYLLRLMREHSNIELRPGTVIEAITGNSSVSSVRLKSVSGETSSLPVSGVFIEVGLIPNSSFAEGVVARNDAGEIIADARCATNVPGIFAAGDVTDVPFKQIIIAAGEGAKAALSAYDYIRAMSKEEADAADKR